MEAETLAPKLPQSKVARRLVVFGVVLSVPLLVASAVLADNQTIEGRILGEIVGSLLGTSLALVIGGVFLDQWKRELDREQEGIERRREHAEFVNRSGSLTPSLLAIVRTELAELVVVAYQTVEPLLDADDRIERDFLVTFATRSYGPSAHDELRSMDYSAPLPTAEAQAERVLERLEGWHHAVADRWVERIVNGGVASPDPLSTPAKLDVPTLEGLVERAAQAAPILSLRASAVYAFVSDLYRLQPVSVPEVLSPAVAIRSAAQQLELALEPLSVKRTKEFFARPHAGETGEDEALTATAFSAGVAVESLLGQAEELVRRLASLEIDFKRRLTKADLADSLRSLSGVSDFQNFRWKSSPAGARRERELTGDTADEP